MAKHYTEELVYLETDDKLGLEGALVCPADGAVKPILLLWFHGNTSRFYDLAYLEMGHALAAHGYAFITCNTRGHDIAASVWDDRGTGVAGGAGWERFADTLRDLGAWVDLAAAQGFGRVVLIGHSYGGARVTYYQAQQQDPRVAGLVLASPDVRYRVPPAQVVQAEQMIAADRGADLLPPPDPSAPWYRLSPHTLLDRAQIVQHIYASEARPPHIAGVRVPILAFYGTEEAWLGGAAELATIRRNAEAAPRVDTQRLPGADHVYWGRAAAAATLIARWVDTLL